MSVPAIKSVATETFERPKDSVTRDNIQTFILDAEHAMRRKLW